MQRLLSLVLLVSAGSLQLFGSMDSELLGMVPDNAKVIAGVDLTSAKNSDLGRYFLNHKGQENHGLDEFVASTGFDPRRDLQYFLFESSGGGSNNSQDSWSMLAHGTFDPERLRALAAQKGGTVQNVQGVPVLIQDKKSSQTTAICFPDTGLAIMGDFATVQDILVNRATPGVLDPALKREVDAIAASNDVWFASLLNGGFLRNHLSGPLNQPPQAAQALQSIVESSGGIRFGAMVDLTLNAVARSPQDANSLADVIRFLAGMAQMQGQKDAKASTLANALANLNLSTNGPNVHITLTVPEKALEQLAADQSDKVAVANAHHHPAQ